MPHKERCLESIHVHAGEYIRTALETHTYGAKAKLLPFRPQDQAQTAP